MRQQVIENAATLGETLLNEGAALVSGGTDNHIVLIRCSSLELNRKRSGEDY